MPKRPCAIVMSPDDSTILCADKFGDVYSLPLTGQTNASSTNSGLDDSLVSQSNRFSQILFTPSANSLTVHTKGNREALRQQQKTKKVKTEQRSLCFDHQLLLGHVSLLTDIVCATAASECGTREYIITSDRDEHIRISRDVNQAHIIENYCLGHTEFVSKLCVLPTHPHLLLSGGGDDYLLLWNWRLGIIQKKINLKDHVQSFKENYDETDFMAVQGKSSAIDNTVDKIAVSKIIIASTGDQTEIVVSCEGYVTYFLVVYLFTNYVRSMPALFVFSLESDTTMHFKKSISLEGNVLDMIFVNNQKNMLYSMDAVHPPFSTGNIAVSEARETRPSVGLLASTKLGWMQATTGQLKIIENMEDSLKRRPFVPESGLAKRRSMRELLYNLESLRKAEPED